MRKSELNASCPVPIFFCLNANATLHYYGTKFAEKGISGHRHNIQHGVEKFAELNFSKIYHDGWFSEEEKDIIEYRHSEVIREEGFPVEPLLKCILCRSVAEKETLLFLLKQFSLRMYNTYRDKILYKPKLNCFRYSYGRGRISMDATSKIKELRESVGMNRRDFSEHTGIPVRTLEDCEAARRTPPEYIPRLIAYQIKYEQMLDSEIVDMEAGHEVPLDEAFQKISELRGSKPIRTK